MKFPPSLRPRYHAPPLSKLPIQSSWAQAGPASALTASAENQKTFRMSFTPCSNSPRQPAAVAGHRTLEETGKNREFFTVRYLPVGLAHGGNGGFAGYGSNTAASFLNRPAA